MSYLTDYGKMLAMIIQSKPLVARYYDKMAGVVNIPIAEFKGNEELRNQVLELLGSGSFVNPYNNADYNFAMEVFEFGGEVLVSIRDVESYC